jgi:class 3 adenylate cyclase
MQCPRCQAHNHDDAKFCEDCGARMDTVCPSCGQVVGTGKKFCRSCGTLQSYTPKHLAERILTSKSALEGERKQVTILFADLKGSMELLANRDPEDARKILDPVLERMMEAVHRYEGTVNQVMGDGIMALFGAPLALEDHAIRGCYATLRMQEAVQRYSEELRRTHGVEVQIRVGLNSGEVVVRSIGSDLRMDYTAVGQATHLAGRMEQLARPGTALLTASTLRLVEGRMEVVPQGALEVKGMAEPVAAYELKGATGARSRLEVAASRGLTPFIGRDAEMAALGEAAGRAAGGRGQVVAVVGEPGVGKSRLILEFTRSAALQDWVVLEGHAMPSSKESPYLPILELLRGALGLQPDDDPDTIRERVATRLGRGALAQVLSPIVALMGLVVDDPHWTRLDAQQQRRRTVDAVKYVLMSSGRERPAAIVMEDLHWADAETLGALDALVDSAGASRVLVIVSYRPEHRHDWGGKTYYRQIAMDALAARETEILLDRLLGSGRSLAPAKQMLAERTGGNPFFLEESVRNLVETHALVGERSAYRLARLPSTHDVPATVFSVLAARIDRLASVDKHLLQTASAIGKDVPRALLDAIADTPPDATAEGLARLQSTEFLHEAVLFPELEYSFRHALTHEVAYGSLTRGRRRAFDARIVAALEARRESETDWRDVDRLAHHATRGEIWDKAVVYNRTAGQLALSRHAHRVAAAYFEQAIAALAHLPTDTPSTTVAIDLRLELRYALGPLGEYRRVFELLTEAKQLAETAMEQGRLGLISCLLCNHATLRFELSQALAHGAQALEIAATLGDGALATATHGMMSLPYYLSGDYRHAAEAGRQAERSEGDVWRERFGLVVPPPVYGASVGSWALAELGEFAEAHRMSSRGLAAAEKLNHPHSIAFACLGLGIVHLRQGASTAAVAVLERAVSLCEAADLPTVFLEVAGPLASAYAGAGRAADAIALLERAVAQAVILRHRLGHALRSGSMAEALLAAGRIDEAAPLAKLYVQLARAAGTRGPLAWGLHVLADVATRSEPPDVEIAETALDECLALASDLGMRPLHARGLLTRGQLLRRLGRRDEARTTVADAAARFRALDMTSLAAACDALASGPPG